MITFKAGKWLNEGKIYIEGDCLSTDAKPTENVKNGSRLLEMDTSTMFAYDEENGQWLPLKSAGGGDGTCCAGYQFDDDGDANITISEGGENNGD